MPTSSTPFPNPFTGSSQTSPQGGVSPPSTPPSPGGSSTVQPPGPTGQNSPGTIADPSRGIVEFAGMVSAQHPLDVHQVHLTAGTQYTVGAFGDEHGFGTLHDPMLWVVDGSNRVVAYDDDTSPTDLDARATFTAPTTGTYYVAVMGYQGSSGTYELGMASTDQLSHSPSS